jgi:hypothetical protein
VDRFDVLQGDAGDSEPLDLGAFEPRRVRKAVSEQHHLLRREQGRLPGGSPPLAGCPAAAANVGSVPSIGSMCASAIQPGAPSRALAGVFRSDCRSK